MVFLSCSLGAEVEKGYSLSNVINEVSDRAGHEFSSFVFILFCQGELGDSLFFLYSFFTVIYRNSDYYFLIEKFK